MGEIIFVIYFNDSQTFSNFKNCRGNSLKMQTSGHNFQVRLHFNSTTENSYLSCPLAIFYEKLTWSSVIPWSQGLHMHANKRTEWKGGKKKGKRKSWIVYALLALLQQRWLLVCIDLSLTLGPWSLVAPPATSGVIMWCKSKSISAPACSRVPWLDRLWTAWTNQRKA